MANAAIYLNAEGYDTARPILMGRHSAGESFLRGVLRYADVDRYKFWNALGQPPEVLQALVQRIHPPTKPVDWIGRADFAGLAKAGVVNLAHPELGLHAWRRRPHGGGKYSLCGVTHTTAIAGVMDALADLMIAPLEPHDGLICTSEAVRASVETQLAAVREHLESQYGPRRAPTLQLATIPLGVNTEEFTPSPEHRKAWRDRLGIPEDAIAALYVGRFNIYGKMNPALMALALERAAQATGRPVWWINSGWGDGPQAEAHFHDNTRALCPSVNYLVVDGRPADTRFSIWSAADLFISLSDNIQETFGLTPVEAMAAGLPSVITDWNGYREGVRHEIDGFRIRTIAPRPGLGVDLAYRHANGWANYDNYVGATSQFTAVDLARAEQALVALITNPDLRRRMGAAARERARTVLDWSAIIPRYQALWGELNARRLAAPAGPPPNLETNPWRMDPFRLFASYPTETLTHASLVALTPGMTGSKAAALLGAPLAGYARVGFPVDAEIGLIIDTLARGPQFTVAEVLANFPEPRRYFIERGLLWLARFDILVVLPQPAN